MSFESLGSTFYHGADDGDIETLVAHGGDCGHDQRAHGFFGDGLYVARYPEPAQDFGDAIAEVTTISGAQAFNAGETFDGNTIIPQEPPSWHLPFLDWLYDCVTTPEQEERWEETIRSSVTPGDPAFDRTQWYELVTEYAAEQGYPIIYWTDSEIVIREPSIITGCARYD